MKKKLASHKLEGLALKRSARASGLGKSRFGGQPDLPADAAWPAAERGGRDLSLAFVAQIALADVAKFPCAKLLPKKGLLSFFVLDTVRIAREVGWSRKFAGRSDAARVIYSAPETKLARRAPPADLPPQYVVSASALSFREVETWPQVEGVIIGGAGRKGVVTLSEEEWRSWAESAPEPPRCGMLGHPYGCEFRIGSDPAMRLLLSLDVKESGLPWDLFGRNGFLFFFAPERAIKAQEWIAAAHKEW